jgi:hypothetical protein
VLLTFQRWASLWTSAVMLLVASCATLARFAPGAELAARILAPALLVGAQQVSARARAGRSRDTRRYIVPVCGGAVEHIHGRRRTVPRGRARALPWRRGINCGHDLWMRGSRQHASRGRSRGCYRCPSMLRESVRACAYALLGITRGGLMRVRARAGHHCWFGGIACSSGRSSCERLWPRSLGLVLWPSEAELRARACCCCGSRRSHGGTGNASHRGSRVAAADRSGCQGDC